MTSALIIITDAYREGNLIPVGSSPTASEQVEALRRLNAMRASVYDEELGEPLADWPVPVPQRTAPVAANWPQWPFPPELMGQSTIPSLAPYPPKNSRIIFGGRATTVYFPEQPDDGTRIGVVQGSGAGDSGVVGAVMTLNGNGRTIQTANTQTFTFASPATAPKQWLYRADLGDWTLIADLATTADDMGFPADLDDLWVSMLAIRLAPRYGKTTAQETAATYTRMIKKLKAKYRQAIDTTYGAGDIPPTYQSYAGNRWGWQ